MCGITGFIDFTRRSTEEDLSQMSAVLTHRGPDDQGLSFFPTSSYHLGLGFRRLSIIDLSERGHQPMQDESGLIIVFNGEIYNYREIREELIRYGYHFHSQTDTEVILKSFHRWGTAAVNKFNGMFAFALYDPSSSTCYFFRDRAGIKPLFYYWNNGLFLFASELKSFHRHPYFEKELDISALKLYFRFGYVPTPYSIFKHTHKLEPGHFLELNLHTQTLHNHVYWNVFDYYARPRLTVSTQEALEHTQSLLQSACTYRMIADVPVGVFLSGGYDSTAVAAILQKDRTEKIKTFTIGFYESEFNEAQFAKQVADYLGTDHTEYYCTANEANDIIPQLPEIYDEPFGDSSAIPTFLVSQLARKQVTVALSADGGDELFGGYNRYEIGLKMFRLSERMPYPIRKYMAMLMEQIPIDRSPFSRLLRITHRRYDKLKRLLKTSDAVKVSEMLVETFPAKEIATQLVKTPISEYSTLFSYPEELSINIQDALLTMQALEYRTYLLDDILVKVDRATMAVSLEGREPLLDYRLTEWLAQLPNEFKYRDGVKKWLLKEIVHGLVPKSLVMRPKMGFGVPIVEWLKESLQEYVHVYLSDRAITSSEVLNKAYCKQLVDAYFSGKKEHVNRIWLILMFQMWYAKWMQ